MLTVNDLPRVVALGRQGENGVTRVEIDVSAWASEYPGIACVITMVAPGGGTPYPVTGVTRDGNTLCWLVGRDATETSGLGGVLLRGYAGDVEVRSAGMRVLVEAGQGATGETPDGASDWLAEAAESEEGRKIAEQGRNVAEQGRAEAEAARAAYGPYDPEKAYVYGEKAVYNGSSYIWKGATASVPGTAPPAGDWLLICEKGDVYVAQFYVDELGQLIAEYAEGYDGATFGINDDGALEVTF
jgi:hypothetical protein